MMDILVEKTNGFEEVALGELRELLVDVDVDAEDEFFKITGVLQNNNSNNNDVQTTGSNKNVDERNSAAGNKKNNKRKKKG